MHKHLLESRMVGCHNRNLIVYSASTIDIRIGKNDDMLERYAREQVIDLMHIARGEVRIGGGVRPFAFKWDGRT